MTKVRWSLFRWAAQMASVQFVAQKTGHSVFITINPTARHTFRVPTTLFCYIGQSKQSFILFIGNNQTWYTAISSAPTSEAAMLVLMIIRKKNAQIEKSLVSWYCKRSSQTEWKLTTNSTTSGCKTQRTNRGTLHTGIETGEKISWSLANLFCQQYRKAISKTRHNSRLISRVLKAGPSNHEAALQNQCPQLHYPCNAKW
jgi:hypothetical protein